MPLLRKNNIYAIPHRLSINIVVASNRWIKYIHIDIVYTYVAGQTSLHTLHMLSTTGHNK